MKTRKFAKYIAVGGLAICLCAGGFLFANTGVLAAATNGQENVKTEYPVIPIVSKSIDEPVADHIPADAQEAAHTPAYLISVHENSRQLPAGALSAGEAAEAAVQKLYTITGRKADGMIIEMIAFKDMEERWQWQGGFMVNDERVGFEVDAISGDVLGISQPVAPEILDGEPFDAEAPEAYWQSNYAGYVDSVEEAAALYMGQKVVATEYLSMGAMFHFTGGPILEGGTETSMGDPNAKQAERFEGEPSASVVFLSFRVTDEYGKQCIISVTTVGRVIRSASTVMPVTEKSMQGIG